MDGLIAYALSKKYADEVGRSILDAAFKTQVEQDRSILQTTGQEKILYFIPKTTAKPSDGYDEYVYSNNAWEQVGVTDVDLSFYATKAEVGNLNNLPTTDKSSIVSAISETFTSVSNGKSLVASAITDKGVSTSSDATFSEMAQNIEAIPTQDNTVLNSLIKRTITSIENSEVTSIGTDAFYNCVNLTSVSFPNATSIGTSAFFNCRNLTSVSFPNATSIGTDAFRGCERLSTLILGKRATLSSSNPFRGADNTIIYVQPEDLSWYSTATNWSALYTAGRVKSIEELLT